MNKIIVEGSRDAPIAVICEPTTVGDWRNGRVMRRAAMQMFKENAVAQGFHQDDFVFISAAPPLTDHAKASDGNSNKFIEESAEEFRAEIDKLEDTQMMIYLGKLGGRALMGKPVKITVHRGQIHEGTEMTNGVPFLPLFSPNFILQRPENKDIYETDFMLAGKFRDGGYDFENFSKSMMTGDYRWVTDLQFLLDDPPALIAVDTETRGYKWYDGLRILCVQISYAKHKAICVPLDIAYWNDPEVRDESSEHLPKLCGRTRMKIHNQLRKLLGNKKVAVCGHNFKFDIHALWNHGIDVANWHADTMQLAFVIDDNMQRKGLDDCARRWMPEMSGYADSFNSETDKSRMWDVKHSDMMEYGCGDADVSRRLAFTMDKLARQDERNYKCYQKIQMPALRMFAKMEREGLRVDEPSLEELGKIATQQEKELYDELLKMVPGPVKQSHLDDPKMKGQPPQKILNFGRAGFVIDWLFRHPDGLCLTPKQFTKTTRHLPEDQRVPSTSSKDHLPYFDHIEAVATLMDYQKLAKMRGTYIGDRRL